MPENINTPANVQALKTTLDTMAQPHHKTGKTHLWDVAVSINRTNAVPLDKSSVIFEDGEAVDKGTIKAAADKATAYPGQIISGLKAKDGKVYVLQPDDHVHSTHIANAGESKTYSDQTKSEKSVYEELATQSNVNYQVNKEAYQRQVVNNARTNTETQIAEFIIESDKSVSIDKNGDIALNLPDLLSDNTDTPPEATTVLDYVKATVKAEKLARETTTGDLVDYIGTTYGLDNKGNLSKLSLPSSLSDTTDRTKSTVIGFIEETVQAEKDVREQATRDLAKYIGTEVTIADTGSTILTGLSIPGVLSDKTSTPSDTVKNLLQYIEATVEAEVQKRYDQDQILLACINNLDLSRVVSATNETDPSKDGVLTINLATKFRDSSTDSETNPLTQYNI